MSMLRLKSFVLFALLTCCNVWSPAAIGGVIANGDFASPGTPPQTFAGWTTGSGFTAPSDGGQVARFRITNKTDAFLVLEQMFDLPGDATRLRFDFLLSTTSGGTTGGLFDDGFQATLFGPSGNGFNPATPAAMDAFFLVESSGSEFTPASGVTVGSLGNSWRRVSLALPSLAPGKYTLEFFMRGDNDGLVTTIDVDNVMIEQRIAAIPEPASIAIWGLVFGGACPVLRRSRRR